MGNYETDQRLPISLPSRRSAFLLTVWRGLLTIASYGVLLVAALNFNQILSRARLGPAGSLFARPLLVITLMAVLLLSVSAVHELGHLLGGRLARLRLHLLVIGPFQIARTHTGSDAGRLHFGLRWGVAPFNGMVASIPTDDKQLRRRMLLFAGAGPLASLLLALVAMAVFLGFRDHFTLSSPYLWLQEIAIFLAAASFLFFTTAMSTRTYNNGLPTDGNRILTLLSSGPATTRWCALVSLDSAAIRGRPPSDWDPTLVKQALAHPDGSYDDLAARLLAYQSALDAGRIDEAAALLKGAIALPVAWNSPFRGDLALEMAYFTATYQRDGAEARRWLEQVRRGRQIRVRQRRAEAAVLLAEGNCSAAIARAEEGLAVLPELLSAGIARAEERWLQAIIEQASRGEPSS